MVINILFSILIIIRFVTGVRLLITGRRNKLPNLIWLSVSMFVTVVILLFTPLEGNPLGNLPISLWITTGGAFVGQAALIVFNQLTFYKDRKSPVAWIWASFIVCTVVATYGVVISESNANPSPLAAASAPCAVLIWVWHGWLAYQALKQVSSEKSVEDWVKSRYRLIVAYSIVLTIGAIASVIRNFFVGGAALESPLGTVLAVTSLITQLVSMVLLFLVWVMPESFRLWLNRNQQKHIDEQVYEQAMSLLNILGAALAKGTPKTKEMMIYGIRKIVGETIDTSDSKKIDAHIVSLGYEEWLAFLNDPEFYLYIKDVAIVNPRNALANAKQALIENQSLFTMQAK